MSDEAPPLKVWAYSAIIVATVAILFFSYCYMGFGPYGKALKKSNESLEAALRENDMDTAAVSIVILGSSLTERALLDPHEIQDSIAKHTNRKTNVLRVAIYYMNMDLAERLDFFKYVNDYPPKYLFIESFGMNLDDNDSSMSVPVPIDATLLSLRNQFRKLAHLEPHDNYYTKWYTFDSKPLPDHDFYTDNFDSITFKALKTKKNQVRKIEQNKIANAAYDALNKKGTKIIFLDMPQSDKLVHNFLNEKSAASLDSVLAFYHQQYGTDYWEYPRIMNDSCFMDGAHLNSKGAAQYQAWFVSQFDSTH